MNPELVSKAKERMPSIPLLINVAAKRVRQLNGGMRPYVKPLSRDEENIDIALREIAEGKLTAEIDYAAAANAEQSRF